VLEAQWRPCRVSRAFVLLVKATLTPNHNTRETDAAVERRRINYTLQMNASHWSPRLFRTSSKQYLHLRLQTQHIHFVILRLGFPQPVLHAASPHPPATRSAVAASILYVWWSDSHKIPTEIISPRRAVHFRQREGRNPSAVASDVVPGLALLIFLELVRRGTKTSTRLFVRNFRGLMIYAETLAWEILLVVVFWGRSCEDLRVAGALRRSHCKYVNERRRQE